MFNYKKFWWWLILVLVIFFIWWLVCLISHRAWAPDGDKNFNQTSTPEITDQWKTQKNNTDILRQINLQVGQKISQEFILKGEARGNWFFESSFPWILENESGEVLGQGIVKAQSDWMTENWVPFETVLKFDTKGAKSGLLILQKDNPSGLSENDDRLEIVVSF